MWMLQHSIVDVLTRDGSLTSPQLWRCLQAPYIQTCWLAKQRSKLGPPPNTVRLTDESVGIWNILVSLNMRESLSNVTYEFFSNTQTYILYSYIYSNGLIVSYKYLDLKVWTAVTCVCNVAELKRSVFTRGIFYFFTCFFTFSVSKHDTYIFLSLWSLPLKPIKLLNG